MSRFSTSLLHNTSAMRKEPILIADSDKNELADMEKLLRQEGFENIFLTSDIECTKFMPQNPLSLVIIVCDNLDKTTGMLSHMKDNYAKLPVVIITNATDTQTVVDYMRQGAFDLFSRPVDGKRLLISIIRALERKMLIDALELATNEPSAVKNSEAFSHILTKNPKMLSIFSYLEETAKSSHPILITGETGVGKELIARAIHTLSGKEPYISVNIAGVDDTVFSDTLFGHKKGAFTGADTAREGLLAKAFEGVLLLDEIGDLADQSQIKLLRLIQENSYYQLGSDTPREMKTKLILATNRELKAEVAEHRFRKDLFYRIRTHHVEIPPLRERMEDLPSLLMHFVTKASESFGKKVPHIPPELLTLLNSYDFPGNIRELEAMVNDAVTVHKKGILSASIFHKKISRSKAENTGNIPKSTGIESSFSKFPTLKECEEYLIEKALQLSDNNQGIAAGMLGISRQALNKRITKKRDS